MSAPPDPHSLTAGVLAGGRGEIARALTLVESRRADHREAARTMLAALSVHAGAAQRIGVTGVPGAGKSTFIDGFGTLLTSQGHRVAVLAVDPSSSRTGGSILGDKTRMARLATDPRAFVRPSPTGGTLGGVARATREAMLVMEAAGYDIVIVETVGVGQSETVVADMVDTFLLLTLARTGDQLQGMKKGILELADVVAVNKADGPHENDARGAARELAGALRLIAPAGEPVVPVLTCSALTGTGIDEVWTAVSAHHRRLADTGALGERRNQQAVDWFWALVRDGVLDRLRERTAEGAQLLSRAVRAGTVLPGVAADQLLAEFTGAVAPDVRR